MHSSVRTLSALAILCLGTLAGFGLVSLSAQSEPCSPQLEQDQKTLQDWADISRYRDENALIPIPAAGEQRVVFLGDSITDFWGRKYGKFFPGRPYVNRGISGQTTPQMLVRFRPDVIALKPSAVVILAGTNDLAGKGGPERLEDIEGNLASMVQLANTNNIRTVLASVLPVCDYLYPRTISRSPSRIIQLNAWMEKYCSRRECIYLDYYHPLLDERGLLAKELTVDCLHPNDSGYTVMRPIAERAIRDALAKR